MSLLHINSSANVDNNNNFDNINNIYSAFYSKNINNIFKNHNICNDGTNNDINNNIKINNNNCNCYINGNANNNNNNNNIKNCINNNINNNNINNSINSNNNINSPKENNLSNVGLPINSEHQQTKMNGCLEVNKTIASPPSPHSAMQAPQHKLTTSWWNYYHNLYINWYKMTFNQNMTFNTNFDPEAINKLIPVSPLYSSGESSYDKYRSSTDENRCANFCDNRYNERSRFSYRVSGECADGMCKLRAIYNHQLNRRPATMLPPNFNISEASHTQLHNPNNNHDNHAHNNNNNKNNKNDDSNNNNKKDIGESQKKKHDHFSNKPVNWMLPDETTTTTSTSMTTTLTLPARNEEHNETNKRNDEIKQCKEMRLASHQTLPLLPLAYFKNAYQPVATHPHDTYQQWSLPPHADVPLLRHHHIRQSNNHYSHGYLFKENFSKAIDTSKSECNFFLPTSSSTAAFLSSSSSLLATTSPPVSQRRLPDCSTSPQPSHNRTEHFSRSTSKHSPPPRFQCDACNKSYSTYNGLSKHKEFHCSRYVKKQFTCPHCECKSYASLGALKMHIRTHTLPCKCKLCGKAFSRPWLLQGHLRTHTGERPFGCPHCCRAFADRSNLRAHMQTHSDVKKYNCNKCGKTFSRMSLLHKHRENNIC